MAQTSEKKALYNKEWYQRNKERLKPLKKVYHKEYYQANQIQLRANRKEWVENNKDIARCGVIRWAHGITLVEYRERFAAQNKQCAICKKPLELGLKTHLDHDHKTGKLREFLCVNCNTTIGKFKDDIKLFYAAISYLEKHRECIQTT